MSIDPRLFAPATLRNREAIGEVLAQYLPSPCDVLEVASGTGEHASFFARRCPAWQWHPTELDPKLLESIRGWKAHAPHANLHDPVQLDIAQHPWPVAPADAVVAVNLLHISPGETTRHLMRGAAAKLRAGGKLIVYGPFFMDDVPTAPGNLEFDTSLRKQDPRWGVRTWESVNLVAQEAGLAHCRNIAMPANNFCCVWRIDAEARSSTRRPGG